MNKIPKYWNTAKKYLSKKDKVMSILIKKYKSPSETVLTSRKDVFYSLCKSIIGQQISVAAANSVFLKFKKKCKNRINAKTISKLNTIQLKSCGLSRQKVKGIKNLAKQTLNKSFDSKLISFVLIVSEIGLFHLKPSTPNLGKYTARNLGSSTSSLVLKRLMPSLEPKIF